MSGLIAVLTRGMWLGEAVKKKKRHEIAPLQLQKRKTLDPRSESEMTGGEVLFP